MSAGDKYRARALELLARAETAKDGRTRAKFENLAAAFNRLALQAERNAAFDGATDTLLPGSEMKT
jgi:hypothetical protein